VERAEQPPGEELERRAPWSGLLRSVVLPLGILALILGGLWYWELRGDERATDDGRYGIVELPAAKNPTGQSPKAEVGRAGPDFLLERPGGGTLRLSDLQGRPVLLNFWASWCFPCRAEIPELVAAYERYKARGLVIVGVNLQEADDIVLDFADEFGMTFPIVIDRDGELGDSWRLGGPIRGIPTTYFIDATGVIRDQYYGPLTKDALAERLAKILPEAGG
jgi:peroxiredoxin